MKSRVQKNQELHHSLATNTESNVENSNLSHFANRLNEIDDQFKRMEETAAQPVHEPTRARQHDVVIEEDILEPVQEINETSFDTFENTYLKDFLDEVKEYNVKKGYRDTANTESNIISELNLASETVKTVDSNAMQSVINEIDPEISASVDVNEPKVELPIDEHIEETRIFSASSLSGGQDLEKTIAMAVQEMVMEDPILEAEPVVEVKEVVVEPTKPEPIIEEEIVKKIEEEVETYFEDDFKPEIEVTEEDESYSFNFDDDKFKKELLEQTQTLQHKIIDQERNMEDMNETMVRTNRMLNVVLSVLLLAIFVVLILVFTQFF